MDSIAFTHEQLSRHLNIPQEHLLPKNIDRAHKNTKIAGFLALRMAGLTYKQIGEYYQKTPASIFNYINTHELLDSSPEWETLKHVLLDSCHTVVAEKQSRAEQKRKLLAILWDVVCSYYTLTPEDMRKHDRHEKVAASRRSFSLLAGAVGFSQCAIGRELQRTGSTIWQHFQHDWQKSTLAEWTNYQAVKKIFLERLEADDTIVLTPEMVAALRSNLP